MDHCGALEALLPTEVEIGAEIRQSGGEAALSEMSLKNECTDLFTAFISGVEMRHLEKMTMIDIDEAKTIEDHLFLVRGETISNQFLTTVITGTIHLTPITRGVMEILVMKRFTDQRIGLLHSKFIEGLQGGGNVKLATIAAAGAETGGME
jgi:hypothetical protein